MRLESLDPKTRMLLSVIPKRNEAVKWEEEDGIVILVYPKNFTRLERFLHKRIGGPADIRRPLDDKGTLIWKMCDGNHNVHQICQDCHDRFKEDIEPVVRRVWGFLETLLELHLITIEKPGDKKEKENGEKDGEEAEEKEGEKEQSP